MNADAIEIWVKRQKTWGSVQQAFIGLLTLLGGIVVLFLTFWLAYEVIWIGSIGLSAATDLLLGKKLHITHSFRLAGGGVFLVLLFVQYFRTNPYYWGEYPADEYGTPAQWADLRGGMGNMLDETSASAKMTADILLTGPRLAAGSWNYFRQARQLHRMDESNCRELLKLLFSRIHALPYEDLAGVGLKKSAVQLHSLEGVQFLQKGLLMSPELRQELSGMNET